jgi:hypothetical protein
MEKLKEELYLHIELYGLQDPRTVAKSQELDIEIVKAMRKEG